ncbi:hypothetical protein QLQ85_08850 [Halomonas sp. M4R5S39]|uniref:hypothetical protein n=1 Tax=Halomonas kalidii TaxID=3043293 RepID=UPI0024A82ECE|nr:hypothetical protein [Halomonas kalidii]MDI5984898.1 hypothetical protein [Halomonas kalidii]
MEALTADDRAILAPAMGDDADEIAAEVAAGRARLLRWSDGSRGVIRLEIGPTGRQELVLVAGAGQGYAAKVAALVAHAERRGWRVRTHIRRPGLARILEGLGFIESERVFIHG